MTDTDPQIALDPNSCRARQETLRNYLTEHQLDAALFSDRHYVHTLTGYWHEQPLTFTAVIVGADGKTLVAAPSEDINAPAADEAIAYQSQKLCTIIENTSGELTRALQPALTKFKRVGTTPGSVTPVGLNQSIDWIDITTDYQYLRRKKEPDEIAMLRHAIRGTDAAYSAAKGILKPGLIEVQLYAAMHAAAVNTIGEPLSGFGNDFQSGAPGGLPRLRPAEAGELAVLDIGVGYRGYRADLCRTFAVNHEPTDAQQKAHARILEALNHAEKAIRPDVSCSTLYNEIHAQLDGWNNYAFFHHLGHGIGLDGHEVPRLNPNWDDTFQPGDVVAVEPGLYGNQLKAGIRLEQNYLVTESGVERLSNFPLDL